METRLPEDASARRIELAMSAFNVVTLGSQPRRNRFRRPDRTVPATGAAKGNRHQRPAFARHPRQHLCQDSLERGYNTDSRLIRLQEGRDLFITAIKACLLYTSPSPRDNR